MTNNSIEAVRKAARKTGAAIPILSRHGVNLRAYQGDGRRFARLFSETWRRLPLWARRRMLGHWRDEHSFGPLGMLFSPSIELTAGWSGREGRGLSGDWACVSSVGHVLRFFSGIVDRMPEPLVRDLIAHELAHVCQYASGFHFEEGPDGTIWDVDWRGNVWLPGELEEDADATMRFWGFDAEAMDEWAKLEGITKVKEGSFADVVRSYDRFIQTGNRR